MEWIKLLRPETRIALLKNFKEQEPLKGTRREVDFQPVTRLYIEGTDMQWILTECDGEGMAFGLCQISYAELGNCWLPEMAELDIEGLKVVEDLAFEPTMTLSGYAQKARSNGGFLIL